MLHRNICVMQKSLSSRLRLIPVTTLQLDSGACCSFRYDFFLLWTIITLITYCLSGRASFYCLSCNWFFCCATRFHSWSLLEGIRYVCLPDYKAWLRYLVWNSSCTWWRLLQYQSCGEFNNFGLPWESLYFKQPWKAVLSCSSSFARYVFDIPFFTRFHAWFLYISSTLSFLHFYNVAHSKFLIYCCYSSSFRVFEVSSGFHEFLEVSSDAFLIRFLEKMT